MTYLKHLTRKGTSTILISSRIQQFTIEFADEHCFVFGRFINAALETFVHDLQTDHEISRERYWLSGSGRGYVGYQEDYRGSVQKMIIVRSDLIDYLKINCYQVNTAINLACDRWRENHKKGNIPAYVITNLTDPKKEIAREGQKKTENPQQKKWTQCGSCAYWHPKDRKTDGKAPCSHPTKRGETYRASFCDHHAKIQDGVFTNSKSNKQ